MRKFSLAAALVAALAAGAGGAQADAVLTDAQLTQWLCGALNEPIDVERAAASLPGAHFSAPVEKVSDAGTKYSLRELTVTDAATGLQVSYGQDANGGGGLTLSATGLRPKNLVEDEVKWVSGFGRKVDAGFINMGGNVYVTDAWPRFALVRTTYPYYFTVAGPDLNPFNRDMGQSIGVAWDKPGDLRGLRGMCARHIRQGPG